MCYNKMCEQYKVNMDTMFLVHRISFRFLVQLISEDAFPFSLQGPCYGNTDHSTAAFAMKHPHLTHNHLTNVILVATNTPVIATRTLCT